MNLRLLLSIVLITSLMSPIITSLLTKDFRGKKLEIADEALSIDQAFRALNRLTHLMHLQKMCSKLPDSTSDILFELVELFERELSRIWKNKNRLELENEMFTQFFVEVQRELDKLKDEHQELKSELISTRAKEFNKWKLVHLAEVREFNVLSRGTKPVTLEEIINLRDAVLLMDLSCTLICTHDPFCLTDKEVRRQIALYESSLIMAQKGFSSENILYEEGRLVREYIEKLMTCFVLIREKIRSIYELNSVVVDFKGNVEFDKNQSSSLRIDSMIN